MGFSHNNKLYDNEPAWSEVDKTALPKEAFAEIGDPELKSTWKYPHHWVVGGTEKDENGVWVDGELYLHKGGLIAAWAAAHGARSGQKASNAVIAHLRAHREALGLEADINQDLVVAQLTIDKPSKQSSRIPKIFLEAYTGEPILQSWADKKVVIDVQGVNELRAFPILLNHDSNKIVGHAKIVDKRDGRLVCEGKLSGSTALVDYVLDLYARGFPWGVSVGVAINDTKIVGEGEEIFVNNRVYKGPLLVVASCDMVHVALVGEPADPKTSMWIYGGETVMKEKKEALSTKRKLLLAFTKEAVKLGFDKELDELVANLEQKLENVDEEKAQEVVDEHILKLRKEAMPTPPKTTTNNSPMESQYYACSLMASLGLKLDSFPREVVDKATSRPASLSELFIKAAIDNGMDPVYKITPYNIRQVLKYAFLQAQAPSTIELPYVLSMVVQRAIDEAFLSVDQSWRAIAKIRPLNDFRPNQVIRLYGNVRYEEVPPGSPIPHGTLGDVAYTIQAKTYGRVFVLSRNDIINDDLGAFKDMQNLLGRGAALALNVQFWSTFLNNSTFFTSARGNLVTSCGLSLDNMGKAVKALRELKGPDSELVLTQPAKIVVPPNLEAIAKQLYSATEIVGGTSAQPNVNVWRGQFEPVVSPYIGANSGLTGGSDTTWYLVADPKVYAVMAVGFVNGKETPTIESVEPNYDLLGVVFRGYYDFGVSLAEWWAGVRCNA